MKKIGVVLLTMIMHGVGQESFEHVSHGASGPVLVSGTQDDDLEKVAIETDEEEHLEQEEAKLQETTRLDTYRAPDYKNKPLGKDDRSADIARKLENRKKQNNRMQLKTDELHRSGS